MKVLLFILIASCGSAVQPVATVESASAVKATSETVVETVVRLYRKLRPRKTKKGAMHFDYALRANLGMKNVGDFVDADENTILHLLAGGKDNRETKKIIELLLKGAKFNLSNLNWRFTNKYGQTAADVAFNNGNFKLTKALMEKGTSLNLVKALETALRNRDKKQLEFLTTRRNRQALLKRMKN